MWLLLTSFVAGSLEVGGRDLLISTTFSMKNFAKFSGERFGDTAREGDFTRDEILLS